MRLSRPIVQECFMETSRPEIPFCKLTLDMPHTLHSIEHLRREKNKTIKFKNKLGPPGANLHCMQTRVFYNSLVLPYLHETWERRFRERNCFSVCMNFMSDFEPSHHTTLCTFGTFQSDTNGSQLPEMGHTVKPLKYSWTFFYFLFLRMHILL